MHPASAHPDPNVLLTNLFAVLFAVAVVVPEVIVVGVNIVDVNDKDVVIVDIAVVEMTIVNVAVVDVNVVVADIATDLVVAPLIGPSPDMIIAPSPPPVVVTVKGIVLPPMTTPDGPSEMTVP